LLAVSGSCRLLWSTSKRFRTKFLAHTDPDRFADTGLCPNAQPHSYGDPEVPDAHQSKSDADSNSDRDSDTNAIIAPSEYHTNSYANTSAHVPLAVLTVRQILFYIVFETRSGSCCPQKQNPPALTGGLGLKARC
jgi:hypothetical protein